MKKKFYFILQILKICNTNYFIAFSMLRKSKSKLYHKTYAPITLSNLAFIFNINLYLIILNFNLHLL